MALIRPKSYEVLITPLVKKGVYGTQQDITKNVVIDDYVKDKGISSINAEVDNGDFDFGVFVFDSIKLKCLNFNGMFSGPTDSRSMFKFSRDKAKIIVNFYSGNSNEPESSFLGIIDDRATKINFTTSEVSFTVLSDDSIINRVNVPAGAINDGTSVSLAIKTLVQLPEITAVLNYDENEINVLNDYTIDVGSYFDGQKVKEALDELLAVSNSVLVVDKDTRTMLVKSREHNSGTVKSLYGAGDLFGRENILGIKNYNDGLQRAFTSVVVNGKIASDAGIIDLFGENSKTIDFDFITNGVTSQIIANDLNAYWAVPKIELQVEVNTSEVLNLNFFDLVAIDYPYRVKPASGAKLPIYGSAIYGSAVYPYIFGDLKIRPFMSFKVVGRKENASKFTTVLKLRQTGTALDDGFFSKVGSYYGAGIYGKSTYQYDAERLNPNRISVYGAGEYGTVLYRSN